MIEDKITISNKAGLHARAAAKLVEVVNQFESHFEIGSPRENGRWQEHTFNYAACGITRDCSRYQTEWQ